MKLNFDEQYPPAVPPNPNLDLYEKPFNLESNSSIQEAKQQSKQLINKVEGKNLFSLPSMIVCGFFLLSTVYIDIDSSLEDGDVSIREIFKIGYLFLGGVAQLVSRASEGKTGVYTPKGLPGLHKQDFIDLDNDGIDDRVQ